MADKELKDRWLTGLGKEKEYNKEKGDIELRLRERRVVWAKLLEMVRDNVEIDSSTRILDIGAEATSVFLALRDGEKYAVDPLFDYLFERHPFLKEVKEYKDVHFICSPIEDLPSGNKFNVMFMLASLDHFGNLKPVVDKIEQLLMPSGFLVIFADCFKDSSVKNIMSFFHLYAYHPHYFSAQDIINLFHEYNLKKRVEIAEIYDDCPFKRKPEEVKIYRLDKLIKRIWRLQGVYTAEGKGPLLVVKLYLCFGLAFFVASVRRKKKPIYPFTETTLLILQKS